MSGTNPLSGSPTGVKSAPIDPMMQHAKMWQHVKSLPTHELGQHADRIDYVLPVLSALASNPRVTSKMVIKATADAVAAQKIPPSQGVQFISQIPSEPEKVQPWLRQLYAANLSAAVHMKAEMMQQAAQETQAAQQPAASQALPVPVRNPLSG